MEKQVYTRITEKLRKNKDLTPLHKLLIGFLNTYQTNPDGTSTKKYFYDTQENLAEELGVSVRTIKSAIQFLEEKEIIYQTQKSKIDKRPQYKNRKAIILVDQHNKLPSTENKSKEVTISTQPISEVQKEYIVAEIKEKEVIFITPDLFHQQTNNKYLKSPIVQILCNSINDGRKTIEEFI